MGLVVSRVKVRPLFFQRCFLKCTGFITSNIRNIMNYKLQIMWKEANVGYFKDLSDKWSGGPE